MKSSYFLTFLLLFTGLAGCKKVIQLKTDEVPVRYVIEATMSDQRNDCRVLITQTVALNEPSVFKPVSDAKVFITEDDHDPVLLTETNPGTYRSRDLIARPDHRYTLNVEIEGQQFTSTVIRPLKTPLDSLYVADFSGFGKVRKFANIIFQDPPGVPNSYRAVMYKNKVQNPNFFLMNDDFSDGRVIDMFLAYFNNSDQWKIVAGDTISVELQCIDPSVYLYFSSLDASSTGEGNDLAAPGNPVTNIQGGALGYFSAYTRESKTVIAE